MATKYITLEDAAARLRMSVDQLKKLRADGDIRGFADRGTWKFRDTDIEEYARKTQADSDPDFPAISDDDFFNTVAGDLGSDSDVRLVPDEPSYKITDEDSDSDVQLVDSSMDLKGSVDPGINKPSSTIRPDSPELEDDSKLKLHDSGAAGARVSDSDVRIVGGKASSGKNEITTDSDIKIDESSPAWKVVESSDSTSVPKRPNSSDITLKDDPEADSDVKLVQGSAISNLQDSDSDVRLVSDSSKIRKPAQPGDSDVKLASDLADSDSDVKLHPADASGVKSGSKIDLDDDSGLTIELDEDSVLINQKSSFGKPDGVDSGISLAGDSGISLELASDSGISLMDEDSNYNQIASDSGISLEPVDESGFTLPPLSDDDIGGTIPMLNLSSDDDIRSSDKTLELTAEDDDDVFNLASDDSHDTTNVVMFDEDDSTTGASFVEDSALYTDDLSSEDGEESIFDLSAVDEVGEEFDADDLELSDDMIGEDDELDVFEAEEGDFEDGFESGESQPGLSTGGRKVAYVAAASAPWTAGTISLLAVSSIMMMFCTLLMFDVVRSMWSLESPMPSTNMLLDLMTSMGL